MANYSRKDAEQQAQAGEGLTVGGILGLAALLIGGAALSSAEKKKLKEREVELEDAIRKINAKINEYENQFLGSWLNSDEISSLKAKRAEYQAELSEIKKKLA